MERIINVLKKIRHAGFDSGAKEVDVDFFNVCFYAYINYKRVLVGTSGESLRAYCLNSFLEEVTRTGEVPDIWEFFERKLPEMKGVC